MARKAGDRIEASLTKKLARLQFPVEIRRFDVFGEAAGEIAAREARAADEFVGLRPNGGPAEPERLVESVLFGAGRHLLLVPAERPLPRGFDHVLIAWNGSREAARALAEAMPYIHAAKSVIVVVVDDEPPVEDRALLGRDAVAHLKHHGVNAQLHHVIGDSRAAGATILGEAQRTGSDLIVMGGYGHSRLREILLGGVTREVMHQAPVPLLIAH
jgi:nucleotide-binding universal stress UspA family protein